MTGALIALAIGALIIVADWHMATKPGEEEKKKRKRRKPLSATDRKSLWDLFVLTLIVAGAVWVWQTYLS